MHITNCVALNSIYIYLCIARRAYIRYKGTIRRIYAIRFSIIMSILVVNTTWMHSHFAWSTVCCAVPCNWVLFSGQICKYCFHSIWIFYFLYIFFLSSIHITFLLCVCVILLGRIVKNCENLRVLCVRVLEMIEMDCMTRQRSMTFEYDVTGHSMAHIHLICIYGISLLEPKRIIHVRTDIEGEVATWAFSRIMM